MTFKTIDIVMGAAAATAQTLPFPVSRIVAAASFGALGTAGDTETALTVQATTPTGSELEFLGTANAPLVAFTLVPPPPRSRSLRSAPSSPAKCPPTYRSVTA